MLDFDQILGIIGSGTRLRLLELLCGRARSLNELASSLGVTQQAVLKHITVLERSGLVQQIRIGEKSRVKKVYTLSNPLTTGYLFKDNILCLYLGFNGHNAKPRTVNNIAKFLKTVEYERSLLHMRTRVLARRLRSFVEEDLRKQAEIHSIIKNMQLSPIQTIALHCSTSMDSEKQLEQASKVLGINLKEALKQLLESQA